MSTKGHITFRRFSSAVLTRKTSFNVYESVARKYFSRNTIFYIDDRASFIDRFGSNLKMSNEYTRSGGVNKNPIKIIDFDSVMVVCQLNCKILINSTVYACIVYELPTILITSLRYLHSTFHRRIYKYTAVGISVRFPENVRL